MQLRRSISVMPSAVRRSSSTDCTSEPFCSRWLLRCACSLTSSWRPMRSVARWKRLTVTREGPPGPARAGCRSGWRRGRRRYRPRRQRSSYLREAVGDRADRRMDGAKELQFAEEVPVLRWLDVVMVGHERSPLPVRPRPSRPSWRSLRRRAGRARTRKRQRRAEAPAEDGRGAAILLRDAKRAIAHI